MIDIEKFIGSLMQFYDLRKYIGEALIDQGLEYKDGKIVLIEDKESEDEKIRKEILKLVKFYYGSSLVCKHTVSKDDMVNWIEKRCETFTKKDVDDAYLKGICVAKHELEKQGEQKSTWSEKNGKNV